MPAADEKAAALREFPGGKASAARRACEKLPSGSLFVGEILQPYFGTISACAQFKIENLRFSERASQLLGSRGDEKANYAVIFQASFKRP